MISPHYFIIFMATFASAMTLCKWTKFDSNWFIILTSYNAKKSLWSKTSGKFKLLMTLMKFFIFSCNPKISFFFQFIQSTFFHMSHNLTFYKNDILNIIRGNTTWIIVEFKAKRLILNFFKVSIFYPLISLIEKINWFLMQVYSINFQVRVKVVLNFIIFKDERLPILHFFNNLMFRYCNEILVILFIIIIYAYL